MTIDEKRAQAILDAQKRTGREVRVSFNYRYAPHHTKVRELIMNDTIGDVYFVHFEWFLNTDHGADYYRRWHQENSGGLLVHKSTHHFDLVNFWLGTQPDTVFAMGGLNFYGRTNAERRGVKDFYYRCHGSEIRSRPGRWHHSVGGSDGKTRHTKGAQGYVSCQFGAWQVCLGAYLVCYADWPGYYEQSVYAA